MILLVVLVVGEYRCVENRVFAIVNATPHEDQTMYDVPTIERVIFLKAHPQPPGSAMCPDLGIELRETTVTLRQDRRRRTVTGSENPVESLPSPAVNSLTNKPTQGPRGPPRIPPT